LAQVKKAAYILELTSKIPLQTFSGNAMSGVLRPRLLYIHARTETQAFFKRRRI